MKRAGPLKRKTPLKATTSLKRSPMSKKPKRKKRSMGKPDPKWRSDRYLDWVKCQPCFMSGAPSDDAHHIIGLGGMGGMGTKAPDWAVMPVTRSVHEEIHRRPEMQGCQWEAVCRTLGKAIEDGVLVLAI